MRKQLTNDILRLGKIQDKTDTAWAHRKTQRKKLLSHEIKQLNEKITGKPHLKKANAMKAIADKLFERQRPNYTTDTRFTVKELQTIKKHLRQEFHEETPACPNCHEPVTTHQNKNKEECFQCLNCGENGPLKKTGKRLVHIHGTVNSPYQENS